jgi:hypothetical protein
MSACGPGEPAHAPRRTWSFPVGEARIVAVQCWRGRELQVKSREGSAIEITARVRLLPASQHGPEPDWRNTPAGDWPFAWEAHREGALLTLASRGETRLPHHRYVLEEVEITVPPGVAVQARRKELETRAR